MVIWVAAGGPSRPTSRRNPSRSGWRAAKRNTERTTASTRSQPSPALPSAASRAAERSCRAAGDHRLQESVLGGEPVQDRLLRQVESLADGVERGGLVPLLAKEARAASRMRSLVVELGTYQMVDKIGGQC